MELRRGSFSRRMCAGVRLCAASAWSRGEAHRLDSRTSWVAGHHFMGPTQVVRVMSIGRVHAVPVEKKLGWPPPTWVEQPCAAATQPELWRRRYSCAREPLTRTLGAGGAGRRTALAHAQLARARLAWPGHGLAGVEAGGHCEISSARARTFARHVHGADQASWCSISRGTGCRW